MVNRLFEADPNLRRFVDVPEIGRVDVAASALNIDRLFLQRLLSLLVNSSDGSFEISLANIFFVRNIRKLGVTYLFSSLFCIIVLLTLGLSAGDFSKKMSELFSGYFRRFVAIANLSSNSPTGYSDVLMQLTVDFQLLLCSFCISRQHYILILLWSGFH